MASVDLDNVVAGIDETEESHERAGDHRCLRRDDEARAPALGHAGREQARGEVVGARRQDELVHLSHSKLDVFGTVRGHISSAEIFPRPVWQKLEVTMACPALEAQPTGPERSTDRPVI